jgi:hypothetical protein
MTVCLSPSCRAKPTVPSRLVKSGQILVKKSECRNQVTASQGVRCVEHMEFLTTAKNLKSSTLLVWCSPRTTLDHEQDRIVQRLCLGTLDGFGVRPTIGLFQCENDHFVVVPPSSWLGAPNSRRIVRHRELRNRLLWKTATISTGSHWRRK